MTFNTDKLANGGLVLLIAYAAFSSVFRAASKSFWCDEVITVGLARLPALGTIRDALEHAADSHPPPFYALERMAAHLPGNELITFRIPSILAYCCMVLCVFLFIKKRRGSACALVCAAIPMVSVLFSTYAVEARGYSLMVGFVALAMVCYQRADQAAWWVAMGLSLAAAESSHYYAVFAILLFGLAELALFVKVRCVRFGVWLALLFGALPLAVFWPLLEGYKRYYITHFTGHLSLDDTARAYGWLFDLHPTYGIGIAATALAIVLTYGLLTQRTSVAGSPFRSLRSPVALGRWRLWTNVASGSGSDPADAGTSSLSPWDAHLGGLSPDRSPGRTRRSSCRSHQVQPAQTPQASLGRYIRIFDCSPAGRVDSRSACNFSVDPFFDVLHLRKILVAFPAGLYRHHPCHDLPVGCKPLFPWDYWRVCRTGLRRSKSSSPLRDSPGLRAAPGQSGGHEHSKWHL